MNCDAIRDQLEAYVLGALDPDEHARVERHLDTCARCRREAAALAETVAQLPEALASRQASTLPPDLRQRVLGAAADLYRPTPVPAAEPPSARWPRLPDTGPRRHPVRTLAFGLPVVLLVASLLWGFRLADALDRERTLKSEYMALVNDVVGQQELVFEVIGFDDTERTFLRAQQEDSTSYGKLFTRPEMPIVVVMAGRLPPAPPDHAFHVWVTADGETTLAGTLTLDEQGFGLLVYHTDRPNPDYDTAVVTLQPTGTTSPEGTEILRAVDVDPTAS